MISFNPAATHFLHFDSRRLHCIATFMRKEVHIRVGEIWWPICHQRRNPPTSNKDFNLPTYQCN